MKYAIKRTGVGERMEYVMRRTVVGVFILALAGVACGGLSPLSDDFESYAVGINIDGQEGWHLSSGSLDQSVTVVLGGSGFNGGSGQSVFFDDNLAAGGNLQMWQIFGAATNSSVFTFDYKCVADGNQRPQFQVQGRRASDDALVPGVWLTMNEFLQDGKVASQSGGWNTHGGAALLDGEWYRVQVSVHDVSGSSDTFDLLITDTNGTTVVSGANIAFANDLKNIDRVRLSTNNDGVGSEFHIDNVEADGVPAFDGFENYTASIDIDGQGGWNLDGGAVGQGATVVSGGSDFDDGSGQSVFFSDNLAAGGKLQMWQDLTATSDPVVFTFDYKCVADGNQRPQFQVLGRRASDDVLVTGVWLTMNEFLQDGKVASQSGGWNAHGDAALLDGEWYRVRVSVNDVSGSSDTFDLLITDTNGTTVVSEANIAFANDLDNVYRIRFGTNNDGIGARFNIDNVGITTPLIPPVISGWSVFSSNVMEMVVSISGAEGTSYPLTSPDLVTGTWTNVAHSKDGSDPFIITNLTYSSDDGTNKLIYVKSDGATAFFGIGE